MIIRNAITIAPYMDVSPLLMILFMVVSIVVDVGEKISSFYC